MTVVPLWTEAALLLLAGAGMVVEPDRFATLGQNVREGIRNLERSLRGPMGSYRRQRFWLRARTPMAIPPVGITAVRVAGGLVISFGLLVVAAGALFN
ncbi:MAG TPA: hypothetical protein VGL72_14815 [Bryobacteraceae bacterium]